MADLMLLGHFGSAEKGPFIVAGNNRGGDRKKEETFHV
jgi:hypothetical protein